VGGKVLRTDRPATLWVAWGRVTWLQSLIALVGEDAPDDGCYAGERAVPWIPGCSLLLRSAALRTVGPFDDDFFAYHEDVEWAARAHAAGWELWYTGAARTLHAVHGSSGGASHYGGFRKYLSARNSVLYAKRHGRPRQERLREGVEIEELHGPTEEPTDDRQPIVQLERHTAEDQRRRSECDDQCADPSNAYCTTGMCSVYRSTIPRSIPLSVPLSRTRKYQNSPIATNSRTGAPSP